MIETHDAVARLAAHARTIVHTGLDDVEALFSQIVSTHVAGLVALEDAIRAQIVAEAEARQQPPGFLDDDEELEAGRLVKAALAGHPEADAAFGRLIQHHDAELEATAIEHRLIGAAIGRLLGAR